VSTTQSKDEILAQRIRPLLAGLPGFVEKRMFGGMGFLVRGNMAVGVHKGELIVRVGPDRHGEALARPHTRQFDMTGRPMQGWVMVVDSGFEADADLEHWVQQGVEYALTLPPK
jgi:TfoX N-terminal domain